VLCGVNEDIKDTMCKWAMAHDAAHGLPKREGKALRCAVSAKWSEPRFTKETVLPIGDVKRLWATLRERHGVRIAVCTSDDREATIEQLSLLGLKPDVIVCGDDRLSSKPSPEPIWQVCHELDTDPSRCIMIGDTVSDVHAGLNAGCAKVAVVRSDGKVRPSLRLLRLCLGLRLKSAPVDLIEP
jgi:HAD superfamily hydrolase (TIGR01509 family)